jgi:hypothetical protein
MANEITLSVNGTKQSLGLRPMRGFAMSLYDAAVRLKGATRAAPVPGG